jgi:hypothetical protein
VEASGSPNGDYLLGLKDGGAQFSPNEHRRRREHRRPNDYGKKEKAHNESEIVRVDALAYKGGKVMNRSHGSASSSPP